MKERGYPEAFIELVTEALVVYMTRRAEATGNGR
jgi:hypothetical protein